MSGCSCRACSIELTISYVYLALHSYADRDNVGLPGFAAWFKDESDGERDHAQLLLNFQVGCRIMRLSSRSWSELIIARVQWVHPLGGVCQRLYGTYMANVESVG
jgi:hypothetical protein